MCDTCSKKKNCACAQNAHALQNVHTPRAIHAMIYLQDDLLLRLPLFLLVDFDDSVVGIPCTSKHSNATNSTSITVFFMLLTLITKKKRQNTNSGYK